MTFVSPFLSFYLSFCIYKPFSFVHMYFLIWPLHTFYSMTFLFYFPFLSICCCHPSSILISSCSLSFLVLFTYIVISSSIYFISQLFYSCIYHLWFLSPSFFPLIFLSSCLSALHSIPFHPPYCAPHLLYVTQITSGAWCTAPNPSTGTKQD